MLSHELTQKTAWHVLCAPVDGSSRVAGSTVISYTGLLLRIAGGSEPAPRDDVRIAGGSEPAPLDDARAAASTVSEDSNESATSVDACDRGEGGPGAR